MSKRTWALLSVISLVVLSSMACKSLTGEQEPSNGKDPAAIRKAITSSHNLAAEALQNGDVDGVIANFSAEFTTAGGSYQLASREAILKGLKSGDLKFSAIRSEVENVNISGNAAVVSGHRRVTAVVNGEEIEYEYDLKAAYVWEQGRWKALLWAVDGGC